MMWRVVVVEAEEEEAAGRTGTVATRDPSIRSTLSNDTDASAWSPLPPPSRRHSSRRSTMALRNTGTFSGGPWVPSVACTGGLNPGKPIPLT